MAYACPVCAFPQADATHLAHHLAFSAMTGDDDHEAWLDEHAPDWADCGPGELADRVLPHAEELEDGATANDLGSAHDHGEPPAATGGADPTAEPADPTVESANPSVEPADLAGESGRFEDDDVDDVLREARELTRQRRGEDAASGEAGAAEDGNGAGKDDGVVGEDDHGVGEDDARTETTDDSETE